MKPLLSILIPTTMDRDKESSQLLGCITEQEYLDKVDVFDKHSLMCVRYWGLISELEVIFFKDNKEMTIGEKRELLYKEAKGVYSWQIDSDDSIAGNAIELILKAIKSNPEIPCITFREYCMMNGIYKSSNHSIRYAKWQDNFDDYDYVRCAFYKDVIRTDIAKSVPFPHSRWNEDEQFSMAIKPFLTDEIHIDKELYFYQYNPKESHEKRYGINR